MINNNKEEAIDDLALNGWTFTYCRAVNCLFPQFLLPTPQFELDPKPLRKCYRCPRAFHVRCIPPDCRYNDWILLCGNHLDEALPSMVLNYNHNYYYHYYSFITILYHYFLTLFRKFHHFLKLHLLLLRLQIHPHPHPLIFYLQLQSIHLLHAQFHVTILILRSQNITPDQFLQK